MTSLTDDLAQTVLPSGKRVGEVLSRSVIERPNGSGRTTPLRERPIRLHRPRWERELLSRSLLEKPKLRDCWLVEAVGDLNLDRVQALLSLPHLKVDKRQPGHDTALMAVARCLARLVESPHPNPQTHDWVRGRYMAILDALLARGANPMLRSSEGKSVPELLGGHTDAVRCVLRKVPGNQSGRAAAAALTGALERGDTATAVFWLHRQKDTACWPNPMAPVVEALQPLKQSWLPLFSKPQPRLTRAQALRWLRHLSRAGFSLDRALHAPASAKEKPKDARRYAYIFEETEDRFKIDDTQDTPLVRVAGRGDVQALRVMLALGASPQAFAPNGRHPFMTWVARWSDMRDAVKRPKRDTLLEFAELFFTPDILDPVLLQNKPDRGHPSFETVHPLGAILNGPCTHKDAAIADIGWTMAHRLIEKGLSCPLPTPKDISVVERVLCWTLHRFQWWPLTNLGESAEQSDRAVAQMTRFLHALPGWREAMAASGSHRRRFSTELIECLGRRGHYPSRILEQLTSTGLTWGPEMGLVHDILGNQTWRPLPYLCTVSRVGDRPVVPAEHPLSAPAIAFLLSQPDTPDEDKSKAFELLLEWPTRPGFSAAVRAFSDSGFFLAAAPDVPSPLDQAAHAATMTPEELRHFYDAGAREANPLLWPPTMRAAWLSWVMDDDKTSLPDATPARPRPRL